MSVISKAHFDDSVSVIWALDDPTGQFVQAIPKTADLDRAA
jgi:hypothetical protein